MFILSTIKKLIDQNLQKKAKRSCKIGPFCDKVSRNNNDKKHFLVHALKAALQKHLLDMT